MVVFLKVVHVVEELVLMGIGRLDRDRQNCGLGADCGGG